LNKFLAEQNMRSLDLLKIDIKGNVPMVLLGSARTLAVLLPSYATFENHIDGHWSRYLLSDVIQFLEN